MAELGATIPNATSTSSDSTRLNEVGELFGQFFKQLFAIVGFAAMNTSNRKSLLMALVFAIFLYYLALVQLHINSFLPFMMVILLLGSVVSILALMVISPTIAWIYLGFWILIFASMLRTTQKHNAILDVKKPVFDVELDKMEKFFEDGCIEV
ncbi:uncharacterized protein [Medicago truncatula]|uniref:uncharacterized protein n=1 Tax=Medicago truncatula TaxID=3880 RepID=UPI001966E08B|nr:uncharacterized protein LOC120576945 [Medicago truncatula]